MQIARLRTRLGTRAEPESEPEPEPDTDSEAEPDAACGVQMRNRFNRKDNTKTERRRVRCYLILMHI